MVVWELAAVEEFEVYDCEDRASDGDRGDSAADSCEDDDLVSFLRGCFDFADGFGSCGFGVE